MTQWWESLTLLQQILFLIATPSTVVLIVQTIMLLIGLGSDPDVDVAEVADASEVDGSSDSGIGLFSVRGVMAFFAVGGFLGIFMIDVGLHPALAILIALAGGFAALVGIAYLMRALSRLAQSGNLNITNAVGKTAVVYIPISSNQPGKVHVTFQDRYTELVAVSHQTLPTNTYVKITKTVDSETVYVEKLIEGTEE